MSKGKLVVISGASGVGKGTVLGIMMKKRDDLKFSVSATTRAPRPSEVDGVHYFFVTKERFEQMIEDREMLEYDAHHENLYGTPRNQILGEKHVVLDIEPNGAFSNTGCPGNHNEFSFAHSSSSISGSCLSIHRA